jgi:DNA invertase Pin-like site-specific DNA recombinase
MKAGLYLRVSTNGQTVENQRLVLEQVAAQRGWEIVETYTDQGISGAKGRDQRPAFDTLCKDATRRRFDVIMVAALDRVGRSVQTVSAFLAEMVQVGVAVYCHREAIDGSTPTGRAMLSMCSVFAELERDLIRDRINAGIARAKASGTKSGRAIGRAPISAETAAKVRAALDSGKSIRAAAKAAGVSHGTAWNLARASEQI